MQKIANFYVKVISRSFKTVKETIEQYLEGGKSQNIEYFDFWLKSVQYNEDDKMISNYSDVHADPYDYYSFLEDNYSVSLADGTKGLRSLIWYSV